MTRKSKLIYFIPIVLTTYPGQREKNLFQMRTNLAKMLKCIHVFFFKIKNSFVKSKGKCRLLQSRLPTFLNGINVNEHITLLFR